MLQRLFLFLFFSLSVTSLSFGKITEVKEMKEILPFITDDTLVVLDIDNTLMEPEQTLGNDQWFRHRMRTHKLNGLTQEAALEAALGEWISVQCISKMQLVEPETEDIVRSLQDRKLTVIGLTTRGLGMATQTIRQLHSIGIHLENNPLSSEEHLFHDERSFIYREGILFTANNHKGNALGQLLDFANVHPKHIVFVNDKHSHLLPVEEFCKERNIPVDGLRYGYLDQKVQNFDPEVADEQWRQFHYILSDDEAKRVIAKNLSE